MGNRLYASVTQKKCPFGCIYCFVDSKQYKRGIDIKTKQNDELIKGCNIIQPACDSELLLEPDWFELLYNLVDFGKSISFATKKYITYDESKRLKKIDDMLREKGEVLNVGITICKYNNYKEIEPFAPDPQKRIEGLINLYEMGIKCNVIIRPIFPNNPIDDFYEIINRTKKYCYGYLLGPLYMNQRVKEYLNQYLLNNSYDFIEKRRPEWNQMSEIDVLYPRKIMKELREYIINGGSRVFDSNEKCIKVLKEIK